VEKLFLTVACGDYDRTKPLQDGSVEPEGIKLNYLALQSEEIFWRMGHYREFDVSEMSLSNHITMIGRGDPPFVGIPIFPSRFFRHSSVYFNVESGIKKPEDFKGKKVGTPEFAMTAAVWIRGFFNDDYGVRARDMKWFLGGQEEPGRKERVKLELPSEISVQSIPDDRGNRRSNFGPQSLLSG
jgi:4,5-dihydroxyphthalate decarboxylase